MVMSSARSSRFKGESSALFRLGLPLIANNLLLGLMTFIDFVMAGKISALDLAAVGIGNTIWATIYLAGMGVMMAMNPIAAQLEGAKKYLEIGPVSYTHLTLPTIYSV